MYKFKLKCTAVTSDVALLVSRYRCAHARPTPIYYPVFCLASNGKADSIECLAQGVTSYAQYISLVHTSTVDGEGEAGFALSAGL